MRRRPARVPEHRRARPCGRPVRRGPLRGRRHPGRPGYLLLSRRARMALLFPVDDRAQHRRARRPEPVQRRRSVHVGCVMRSAREVEVIDDGDIARWTAEHDGYASLDPPARHRRSVLLDRASRSIDIIDEIDGRQPRHPPCLPSRSRRPGGARRVLCGPALARRVHARRSAAGTAVRGCGGACTAARPTPSSAGTPPA